MARGPYEMVYCLFKGTRQFVEVNEATISSDTGATRPVFVGPYAEPYNLMIHLGFGPERYNYTSIIEDSYGAYNESSGNYDNGCMAAMQQGRADAAIIYATLPVVAAGLRQQAPYAEDQLVILSYYNVKPSGQVVDVLTSFALAFDIPLWSIVLATICVLWFLLKGFIHVYNSRCQLKRNSKRKPVEENTLYQVLTHVMQVETLDYPSSSLQFVSLIVTFLSFYLILYLSNLMNTSLIVQEPPNVIGSYDDLLKVPIIRPLFWDLQTDYKEFEFARPGSKEHRIWQRALKNFKRRDLFVSKDFFGTIFDFIQSLASGRSESNKTVAIFSKFVAPTARCVICAVKARCVFIENNQKLIRQTGLSTVFNTHSYITADPETKKRMIGSVFRDKFNSPLAQRINKRCTFLMESGAHNRALQTIQRPMFGVSEFNAFQHQVYKKCIEDDYHVNMENHEDVLSIKMSQMKKTLTLFSVLAPLATFCLLIEFSKAGVRRKRTVAPLEQNKVTHVALDMVFRSVYLHPVPDSPPRI